jgi:hypothetical protein
MGVGEISSLVVSREPDFLDVLWARLYFPLFTYTYGVVALQPWLTAEEQARGEAEEVEEYAKTLFLHRFDFSPHPSVRIGLTEGIMFGKRTPPLTYYNPLIVFHNEYLWEYSSSLFSADLAITPMRFLSLHGAFVLNQLQTRFEQENFDSAIPNARGWNLGLRWAVPVGPGVGFGFFEYAQSDPWLYVREHPLISFHWRRRALSNLLPGRPIYTEPLGFAYGPDTVVFALSAGFELVDTASAQIEARLIRAGEQTVNTPYQEGPAALALSTPSGTPERSVELRATFAARTEIRALTLEGELGLVFRRTEGYTHVEGRRATSFEVVPSISIRY